MLSGDVIKEIKGKIHESETVISYGLVKLYTSEEKRRKWVDSKLSGMLVLVLDKTLLAFLIRLYEISKLEVTFETEVYFGFSTVYRELNDTFHCFPVKGGLIGLSFAYTKESESFYRSVLVFSPPEIITRVVPKQEKAHPVSWLESVKSLVHLNKVQKVEEKIEEPPVQKTVKLSRKEKDFILASVPEQLQKLILRDPPSPHSGNISNRISKNSNISGSTSNEAKNSAGTNMKIIVHSVQANEGGNSARRSSSVGNRNFLNPNLEHPREDRKNLGKSVEPVRKPGDLYRELLKKGVANRHQALNQYGNSEFSSGSSSK